MVENKIQSYFKKSSGRKPVFFLDTYFLVMERNLVEHLTKTLHQLIIILGEEIHGTPQQRDMEVHFSSCLADGGEEGAVQGFGDRGAWKLANEALEETCLRFFRRLFFCSYP
jgi:hypothetical protein